MIHFPMTKEEIEIFAYNQGILRNLHKRQTAVKQRMILDKCRDYETNKRRERGVRIRFSRNTLFEF